MSDFDKEAEREKLREKYEHDKQERQATQRMSDLLLKGATMTNSHCGTCGDPLFQQDGTTFCPSCHGNPDAVEGTNLEAQPAEGSPDTPTDRTDEDASTAESALEGAEMTDAERGSSTQPDQQRDRPADAMTTDERHSRPDASPSENADPTTADVPSRDQSTPSAPPQSPAASPGREVHGSDDRRSTSPPAASSTPADGDLEAAHASLVQALEKFAGKAATTDDPRHAKDCLEAAREASETLETLR